jgi:hypothetical protein
VAGGRGEHQDRHMRVRDRHTHTHTHTEREREKIKIRDPRAWQSSPVRIFARVVSLCVTPVASTSLELGPFFCCGGSCPLVLRYFTVQPITHSSVLYGRSNGSK